MTMKYRCLHSSKYKLQLLYNVPKLNPADYYFTNRLLLCKKNTHKSNFGRELLGNRR